MPTKILIWETIDCGIIHSVVRGTHSKRMLPRLESIAQNEPNINSFTDELGIDMVKNFLESLKKC